MERTKLEYGLGLLLQTRTFGDCTKQANTEPWPHFRSKKSLKIFVRDFVESNLEVAVPSHDDDTFLFAAAAVAVENAEAEEPFASVALDLMEPLALSHEV